MAALVDAGAATDAINVRARPGACRCERCVCVIESDRAQPRDGCTALHCAAYYGCVDVVRRLLRCCGAGVSVVNK